MRRAIGREVHVLWGLIEFLRDIAVLAAAVGVAKWTWDQHSAGPRRRDEEAKALMAQERGLADLRGDVKQWGSRMEALAVDVSTRLDEVLGRQREAEQRAELKADIHRTLHATSDPFLTISEIGKALAGSSGARASETGTEAVSEVELRRALMEMVADGMVEQIVPDRYFIASDFDADEEA